MGLFRCACFSYVGVARYCLFFNTYNMKRAIGKVIVGMIILMSLTIIIGNIVTSCSASFLTVKGRNNTINDTTTDEAQVEVDDDGILKTFTPIKVPIKVPLKLITKDTLVKKQLKDTVKK